MKVQLYTLLRHRTASHHVAICDGLTRAAAVRIVAAMQQRVPRELLSARAGLFRGGLWGPASRRRGALTVNGVRETLG